ncbi:Ras-like GTP-binding protein RYL1 [Tritrichomonas foetus]|uniref:Ras-related protein Rab-1 n=1 Tax=Tritrichomonas foetus TaxID=1144522 RepID=A0A1J4KI35_9EUKA|nr:Ras-like GTP-binding protein RYL1 [Tritrichomonas foetus]|eukprot:OHT10875.1 Ras-like GTP-binding protein RYL1 [Tritrichomonas foetus]
MDSGEQLIKVLLIGESAVGKSCLLLRFAEDKFNDNFLTTIGIDFKVKHIIIDDAKIKLQIWDTAGQEKFRTITKAYYRGAHGILVIFDVSSRDSFNQVRNWMRSIQESMTEPVEIALVGNKCDLERFVTQEEAQSLAEEYNVPYFETSALSGYNVESTFIQIAARVKRQRDISGNTGGGAASPRKVDIKRGDGQKKEKNDCC